MARRTEQFEINIDRHRPAPLKNGFDFVGNGILLALLAALGLYLYDQYQHRGLHRSTNQAIDFVPDNLISGLPWGDIVAGLIVGITVFFILSRVRFRLVPALISGMLAFWALPTMEQVQAHFSTARDTVAETLSDPSPAYKIGLLPEPTSPEPAANQPSAVLDIEPAAGHTERQAEELEPAPRSLNAEPIVMHQSAPLGIVTMADGTMRARLKIGQNWITARVRPEQAASSFNRFDLLRLGLQPRSGELAIVPRMQIGAIDLVAVGVQVAETPDAHSVIGADILSRIETSTILQ